MWPKTPSARPRRLLPQRSAPSKVCSERRKAILLNRRTSENRKCASAWRLIAGANGGELFFKPRARFLGMVVERAKPASIHDFPRLIDDVDTFRPASV